MAGITSSVFIVCMALLVSGPAMAEETNRDAEVRAAVDEFGRAFVEADASTLKSLLSENYIHVNGRSGNVLSRDDWLKFVKFRRTEIEKGELEFCDYRLEDVRIAVDEDTATVVGTVVVCMNRNGSSNTSKIGFSNTWLYREGIWRRAAFHDSPLPQPNS